MTDVASPDLAALARRLHELAAGDPARAHLAEQCDKIVRSTETAQRAVCESACQALVALLAQPWPNQSL
jgi:hypothetical protein